MSTIVPTEAEVIMKSKTPNKAHMRSPRNQQPSVRRIWKDMRRPIEQSATARERRRRLVGVWSCLYWKRGIICVIVCSANFYSIIIFSRHELWVKCKSRVYNHESTHSKIWHFLFSFCEQLIYMSVTFMNWFNHLLLEVGDRDDEQQVESCSKQRDEGQQNVNQHSLSVWALCPPTGCIEEFWKAEFSFF